MSLVVSDRVRVVWYKFIYDLTGTLKETIGTLSKSGGNSNVNSNRQINFMSRTLAVHVRYKS